MSIWFEAIIHFREDADYIGTLVKIGEANGLKFNEKHSEAIMKQSKGKEVNVRIANPDCVADQIHTFCKAVKSKTKCYSIQVLKTYY